MAVFLTILVPALKDVSHILLVGRKEEQMEAKGFEGQGYGININPASIRHYANIHTVSIRVMD